MLRRIAAVSAIALAVVSWSAVGLFIYDAATAKASAAEASLFSREDPCNLAAPLGTGFDRHCDLEVKLLPGGTAVAVNLDERWEGPVLTQTLSAGPGVSVKTRGAPPPTAARIAQLRAVPISEKLDHLAYNVGNCAGLICGSHDVVLLGADRGSVVELLKVRLGRGGRFELSGRGIALVEPYVPSGATAPTALQVRTYAWDGAAYVQRGVEVRATPSPSAAPR